jgi:hypothetical protein
MLNIDSIDFLEHVQIDPKKVLHMPTKVSMKKKDNNINIPKLNIDVKATNAANPTH